MFELQMVYDFLDRDDLECVYDKDSEHVRLNIKEHPEDCLIMYLGSLCIYVKDKQVCEFRAFNSSLIFGEEFTYSDKKDLQARIKEYVKREFEKKEEGNV